VLPVPVEYDEPPIQSVQTVTPAAEEYVPAIQDVQVADVEAPRAAENVPGKHFVHCSDVAIPATEEYVPAIQDVQVADVEAPRAAENVPGKHFVHCSDVAIPETEE
jgi:hypothetical protein